HRKNDTPVAVPNYDFAPPSQAPAKWNAGFFAYFFQPHKLGKEPWEYIRVLVSGKILNGLVNQLDAYRHLGKLVQLITGETELSKHIIERGSVRAGCCKAGRGK